MKKGREQKNFGGRRTITIEGKGNYKDNAQTTWQITENDVMKGIDENGVTAPYDGQPHSNVKVSVGTPSNAEITYCATKDGEYTNTPPEYTAVGKYTIYYKITHPDYETETGTVTRGGVIKAKKEGTCTIYVYAQNGMYRKVKVTVK